MWIANMTAKTLAELEPASGSVTETDVGGVAVQIACVPNGKYVFVSLYDTKEVVRYELGSKKLTRIALPAEAQGPVQLPRWVQGAHGVVLSDDGALAYVTNLSANTVSVVDTVKVQSIATIEVGMKPNGISHWHVSGGMP